MRPSTLHSLRQLQAIRGRGWRHVHTSRLQAAQSEAATATHSSAAAASPSASASTSAASSSSSVPPPPKNLPEAWERTRTARRNRMWTVAVVTAASFVMTSYRIYIQQGEQERQQEELKQKVQGAQDKMKEAQEKQAKRIETTKQLLDAAVPALAATANDAAAATSADSSSPATSPSPPSAPTSFLTAAVLSVRQQLGLSPQDSTVRIGSTPIVDTPAVAATPAPKVKRAVMI